MDSSRELVEYLIKQRGILKTDCIIDAFLHVDRADFVVEKFKKESYGDYPLPTFANQTISQPYTVAFMLELLSPLSDSLILDVGCGSCYTTALLASIAKKGRVVGVEIVEKLVEFCKRTLSKYGFDNIEIYNADKIPDKNAKYDRILVSASAKSIPDELINAMKDNAKMVIPVQSSILLIEKRGGKLFEKEFYGFAFVELR